MKFLDMIEGNFQIRFKAEYIPYVMECLMRHKNLDDNDQNIINILNTFMKKLSQRSKPIIQQIILKTNDAEKILNVEVSSSDLNKLQVYKEELKEEIIIKFLLVYAIQFKFSFCFRVIKDDGKLECYYDTYHFPMRLNFVL